MSAMSELHRQTVESEERIRDAAFEMLEALQAVEMDAVGIGRGENSISDEARAKVEAAIAKAEGRS